MIVILDVSAAIEILLKKEKKDKFESPYQTASWVIAPDLYVAEISNVWWKYYRAKIFSREDCLQYADDGIKMIDDFIDSRELWQEALAESMVNNHSVYDMLYVALAKRHHATLLTNDKALAELCECLKVAYLS